MGRGRVKGAEGSVRQFRSGRWQAYLPPSVDPLKRPVDPGVTYETRGDAEAALNATMRGLRDGSVSLLMPEGHSRPTGPYTVEMMLDTFLREHRDLSPASRRKVKSLKRAVLCKPGVGIGSRPVRGLTTPFLRQWKLSLGPAGVTASMEQAAWSVLSSALQWEVDMGRMDVSPATLPKVRRTKAAAAARRPAHSHTDDQPTWAEFAKMVAAIRRRSDRLMALTMAWSGARLSEAAALRPTDVTRDGLTLTEVWEIDDVDGEWKTAPLKDAEERTVLVPAGLATVLRAEVRRWHPVEDRADVLFRPAKPRVWPGVYTRWTWRDSVWGPMREATKLAAPTASLRGYAASVLVDAGASLLEVRDLLGHESTVTTEKHYARAQATLQTDRARMAIRHQSGLSVQHRMDALWKAWVTKFGDPMRGAQP